MEFSKFPPSKRLDTVLRHLIESKFPDHHDVGAIYQAIKDKGYTLIGDEIKIIIKKLLKDEYINIQKRSYVNEGQVLITLDVYYATFEGEVLLETEGGYSGRLEQEYRYKALQDQDRLEIQENRKQLFVLTVLACCGTLGNWLVNCFGFFQADPDNSLRTLFLLWLIPLFFLVKYLFQKIFP